MTDVSDPNPPTSESAADKIGHKADRVKISRLPGMIAVSCYMLLLAESAVVYVLQRRVSPLYLLFAVTFIASALGLLFLLRWAWALALAAVAFSAGWSLWSFSTQHSSSLLLRGLLNLIIFLYLVRNGVRAKLR